MTVKIIKHTMTQVGGLGLPNATILHIFRGPPGDNAYQVAVAGGFVGNQAAWLASIKGEPGTQGSPGDNAYQVAVSAGFVGNQAAWLASIEGDQGTQGIQGIQGPPSVGGGALNGNWNFDAGTTAVDPGAGEIAFNNAAYASVTALYISQTNAAAGDVTNYLSSLKVNDSIFVQDAANVNKWIRVTINTIPTDNGAWWTIPVTYASSGSGGIITAAQSCIITFLLGQTASLADGLITSGTFPNVAYAVADDTGLVALAVKSDGTVEIDTLDVDDTITKTLNGLTASQIAGAGIAGAAFTDEFVAGVAFAVRDDEKRMPIVVLADGTIEIHTLDVLNINGLPASQFGSGGAASSGSWDGTFLGEYTYFQNTGQSLASGPAYNLTSAQEQDNLCLKGRSSGLTAFSPLTNVNLSFTNSASECPVIGAMSGIKQFIKAESGIDHTQQSYKLVATDNSNGSYSIAVLVKGQTLYNFGVSIFTDAYNIAVTEGKSIMAGAVFWTQGEANIANYTRTDYKNTLKQIAVDYDADLRAVNGQTRPVPLISYQMTTDTSADRRIAMAHMDCHEESALCYVAAPTYFMGYLDTLHIDAFSSKWLGAYYGLVFKRVAIDGIAWEPLKPISHWKQGKVISLNFNKKHLVMDTATIPAQTNFGFDLVDSAGASLGIASVAVINTSTVRITASATIPAGARVRVGWVASTGLPLQLGSACNLRDSAGDALKFTVTPGVVKRMDNWCTFFDYAIS